MYYYKNETGFLKKQISKKIKEWKLSSLIFLTEIKISKNQKENKDWINGNVLGKHGKYNKSCTKLEAYLSPYAASIIEYFCENG